MKTVIANSEMKYNLIMQADLQTCMFQIKSTTYADPSMTIGDDCRPCDDKTNPDRKKPAKVYKKGMALSEARPIAKALHAKLLKHNIWLWTGGDIEHRLGLTGPRI